MLRRPRKDGRLHRHRQRENCLGAKQRISRRAAMEYVDKTMHDMRTELQKFRGNIGEKHFGVATHIIDPHNFYIVPLMCYRLMSILEKPGPICENVQAYETVIYKSPTLKTYVRGVVQCILLNDVYEMNAIDYGLTEHVIGNCMFQPLHKEALNMPPLAMLCGLTQCYPRGRGTNFTEDLITAFEHLMGDKEKLTITIMANDQSKLGVSVMSSRSNPDDISTVMAHTNLTVYFPAPL